MARCEFKLDPKKDRTQCNVFKGVTKVNGGNFCPKHQSENSRNELHEAHQKVKSARRWRENKIARDKKLAAEAKAKQAWIEERLRLIQSHQATWLAKARNVFEQVKKARENAPELHKRYSTNEMTASGKHLTHIINAGRTAFYALDDGGGKSWKKFEFEFKGGTGNAIDLSMDMDCQRYKISRDDITNGLKTTEYKFDESLTGKNKFRFYQNHPEGDILVHVDF